MTRFSKHILGPVLVSLFAAVAADAAVGETRADTIISGTALRSMNVSGANRQKACFDACQSETRCVGASIQLSSAPNVATACRLYSQAPTYKPLKGWVSWRRTPTVVGSKLTPTSPIAGPIQTPLFAIDLAAQAINFKVLRKLTPGCGGYCEADIEVEAIVKNVGSQAFSSNPNQAIAYLYSNNTLVARLPLATLAPGATVSVKTVYRFSKSEEFPPTYKLQLGWDPDIRLDGNPANDDANRANDSKSRPSAEMRNMF